MTSPIANRPILKVVIEAEQHVVDARQRARQIAAALGFDHQDQVRIATAVSELARNAYQYALGGVVEFTLISESEETGRQLLEVTVSDRGRGIDQLSNILSGTYTSPTGMGVGLLGAKKLSDVFEIESSAAGTVIKIGKRLPPTRTLKIHSLTSLSDLLLKERTGSPSDEIRRQNTELLQTLDVLNQRQADLNLLNQELSETNRGVVALYAELDEKASSLQKANEVKTNFLSNMTHEFRTPLTSIISLTRLLTDRLDGELTNEQEKQVTYIRKSAESLLEIVGDLLDLAKVEAGRITLNVGDFEIDELFGTLRGVFRPVLSKDSSVELLISTTASLPTMKSDEGKLSQILRNLISNALKFTETGIVEIEAEMADDDFVLCKVRDSGIGIGSEDLERVFEDYSQVESKLQKRARGTGLGLPLSRKLSRLLGGDLWVESELGAGSTFFVKVPRVYSGPLEGQLVHQSASPSTSVEDPAAKKRSPVIYIIDDDETSRYVLKTMLRSLLNFNVLEFSSPSAAFASLSDSVPDLIFLDLSMPDMSGFDTLRALKSNESWSAIPVCINSAKILTADEIDFLRQLSVGILSKERSHQLRAVDELKEVLLKSGLLPLAQTTGVRA